MKDGKARGYAIRELKIGSKGFPDRVTQKEIIPSKDPYSDIYAEIDAAEAIKQLNKREPIDERTRYKLTPTREEAIKNEFTQEAIDSSNSKLNMTEHVINNLDPTKPNFESTFKSLYERILNSPTSDLPDADRKKFLKFLEDNRAVYDSIIAKEKAAEQKAKALIDVINNEFNKLGLNKLGVELVIDENMSSTRRGEFYHNLLRIAMNAKDLRRNNINNIETALNALGHESIHLFRTLSLISNEEFNALAEMVGQDPDKFGWDKAIDDYYRDFYRQQKLSDTDIESNIAEEKVAFALGKLYSDEMAKGSTRMKPAIPKLPAHRRVLNKFKNIIKAFFKSFIFPKTKSNKEIADAFINEFIEGKVAGRRYVKDASFSTKSPIVHT